MRKHVFLIYTIFLIMMASSYATWNPGTHISFENKDAGDLNSASNPIVQAFESSSNQGVGIIFDADEIETSSGNYNWGVVDQYINLANNNNKDVYFRVDGSPISGNFVDWNPGPYYRINLLRNDVLDNGNIRNRVATPDELSQAIAESEFDYCNDPNIGFAGVYIFIGWGSVELDKDTYDWSVIDRLFDEIRNCSNDLRIGITIDFASNGKAWCAPKYQTTVPESNWAKKHAPADLHDDDNSLIFWRTKPGSNFRSRCYSRIWDPTVEAQQRYRDFVKEVALRYGDDPLFEHFSPKAESATGIVNEDENRPSSHTTYSVDLLNEEKFEICRIFRQYAPNTMCLLGINFLGADGNQYQRYENYLEFADEQGGIGFTCPDTFARHADVGLTPPATVHEQYLTGGTVTGRYAQACSSENPSDTRYRNIVTELWPAMSQETYTANTFFRQENTRPNPSTGMDSARHQTHPIITIDPTGTRAWGGSNGWEAAFNQWGYDVAQDGCPISFTENGISCVTGRTNQGDPNLLSEITSRYSSENRFGGFFTGTGDASGGTGNNNPPNNNLAECQKFNAYSAIDSRYARPYYVDARELFMKARCGNDNANFEIGIPNSNFFIYDQGYVWDGSSWQSVSFSGDRKRGEWIVSSAQGSISGIDPSTDNYVLSFVCRWHEERWKCGCRSYACQEGPKWNVQHFTTS